MTNLSPAAEAVLDAALELAEDNAPVAQIVAAAICAAVMESLPRIHSGKDRKPFSKLLDIAYELEGLD